ncbi:hypothetical protein K227x_37040 [Rubripirellula lacrimiformis]|uniref:Uncharacterized protein n=1 Tax=Rubripirellula lacrimiformis TaxID=1930273 RepID=A0A517NDU3_9BACT|nr:hypothetical protein [Rubripirellula lacrimiformis]QDT05304.1 hypothetical protein K227x_37040 [Rubripirellula lacrimiformis]
MIDTTLAWLQSLEWTRLFPELLGKMLGVLMGAVISWWLLFRKRLKQLDRLKRGESDELLFQAHFLQPTGDGKYVLFFRNVAPRRTIDQAYENPVAQDALRKLASQTTLNSPVIQTDGRIGFEILNDAISIVSGSLATSPIARRVWLFCMTCEDRNIVRKECVRCFLFRSEDLEHFADWKWCRTHVQVERPWHWVRIVTLHRIARYHHDEQLALPLQTTSRGPLIDDQRRHRRIMALSLGIYEAEVPIGDPVDVDWDQHNTELEQLDVTLEG